MKLIFGTKQTVVVWLEPKPLKVRRCSQLAWPVLVENGLDLFFIPMTAPPSSSPHTNRGTLGALGV